MHIKGPTLNTKPPRPAAADKPRPPAGRHEQLIDTLKRRSTLVNMIDPVGMSLGLLSQPVENFNLGMGIARDLFQGNSEAAQAGIKKIVDVAVNPEGAANYLYRGGQVLGALVDGTVGTLEIVDGLSTGNHSLAWMGVADFVGGTSSAVAAAGLPGISLGLTLASAVGRTGLVIARPNDFNRIQKAKTFFDAGFTVGNACLRAGVAVVPVIAAQCVFGPVQIAYMNHDGFREKVDGIVDWTVGKVKGAVGGC